jgi:Domain of unknown function (DUF6883)
MKLPERERALIPEAKVRDFLLSLSHPVGRHKARFFIDHGFLPESWESLADALIRHAMDHEVAQVLDLEIGIKYVIEGSMPMPDGRSSQVRSIWMIDIGEQRPRFITAYPRPAK